VDRKKFWHGKSLPINVTMRLLQTSCERLSLNLMIMMS